MSKPPDSIVTLSATLSLSEYRDPKNGAFGFWQMEIDGMMRQVVLEPKTHAGKTS